MAAITICCDFGAPTKVKSATVSLSVWHEVMGPDAMIFVFCRKGWCHLCIWSYWYFLPAILIPACALSSPVFLMMYSAYKLNKQGDNIQPCCTPFPVLNQFIVPYLVLTVASWPAYRVLRTLKISQFYHLFVCCCIFVNMLAMFQTYLCRVKQ